MEQIIKERILGCLLIMSIALFVLPLLFGHNIPLQELKSSKNTSNFSVASTKLHKVSIPLPPRKSNPHPSDLISNTPSSGRTQTLFLKPFPKNLENTKQLSLIQTPPHLAQPTRSKLEQQAIPMIASNKPASIRPQTLSPPFSTPKIITKKPDSKKSNITPIPHKTLIKPPKPLITRNQGQKNKIWAIQVGSFSDTIKAKKLITQLQAKGFSAYTRTNATTNFTRVFVGPKRERNGINSLLSKLQKSLHIQGIVVVES